MSVTRKRIKGENLKPEWEFHDGPYFQADLDDALEELKKLNKEKTITYDKENNTAEQVSYQLTKRKATEDEMWQFEEEERELGSRPKYLLVGDLWVFGLTFSRKSLLIEILRISKKISLAPKIAFRR